MFGCSVLDNLNLNPAAIPYLKHHPYLIRWYLLATLEEATDVAVERLNTGRDEHDIYVGFTQNPAAVKYIVSPKNDRILTNPNIFEEISEEEWEKSFKKDLPTKPFKGPGNMNMLPPSPPEVRLMDGLVIYFVCGVIYLLQLWVYNS